MIVLEELDTEFGPIRIVESKEKGTRTYYQGRCFHSQAGLDGVSTCVYVHLMFSLIRQSLARRVLMIGCAGGTLASMLHKQGTQVTVVDINPHAFNIARRYFQMPGEIECVTADGLEFLRNTQNRYDAIAIDAFSSDSSIPGQFITHDFFRIVNGVLEQPGLAIMNVMSEHDLDTTADRIGTNMNAAGLPSVLYDWQGRKDRNTLIAGGAIRHLKLPSGKEPAWVQKEMAGMTSRAPIRRFNWHA